jgi:hypothetical protein
MALIVGLIAAVLMAALIFFLEKRSRKAAAILQPTLGILRLDGAASERIAAEDRAAIERFFAEVRESAAEVPRCDVLFVYASIGTDGRIAGTSGNLRDVIRDSGAKVAVVATDHPIENYIATTPRSSHGAANLVMTLDRKGDAFPRFYADLFGKMSRGTSMPVAWVEIAPQIPGKVHEGVPDSVFAAEVGQVTLQLNV